MLHFHFIAIGGSIMHQLALDAQKKGFVVTGSDDEIFEPAKSRLQNADILPNSLGWFADKITNQIDTVIVGMHTKADNPELLKAKELGLKIYSFPEYIFQQSQQKHRVVIAGSHGKTTVTSMIMHVLNFHKRKFDYVVGASVQGFESSVKLSVDAPVIILEGDEYPSAPFDPTPKFLHYHAHIGAITGVAWDHINVYPTWDKYLEPFEDFAEAIPKSGALVYSQEDSIASVIGAKELADMQAIPYLAHPHKILDGITYLTTKNDRIKLEVFGEHNLKNLACAKAICSKIGITEDGFYQAISTFKGASKRLEKVKETDNFIYFKDFAHAPSKVSATTKAVKNQFVERKLVACFELHTYSSLNTAFIPQYKDTLAPADIAIVYYDAHTLALKNMPKLDENFVKNAFDHDNLHIFTDFQKLKDFLQNINWYNKNLLLMSSGSLDEKINEIF
jgi:UDP-N-acetylmuramate: L-alanyl-gamma-D-glutamyl-meso-diaminopimelate ligase